jgi:hypothetical protein
MSLPNGTRLGPYEVVSAIGAGGMGEVKQSKQEIVHLNVVLNRLAGPR